MDLVFVCLFVCFATATRGAANAWPRNGMREYHYRCRKKRSSPGEEMEENNVLKTRNVTLPCRCRSPPPALNIAVAPQQVLTKIPTSKVCALMYMTLCLSIAPPWRKRNNRVSCQGRRDPSQGSTAAAHRTLHIPPVGPCHLLFLFPHSHLLPAPPLLTRPPALHSKEADRPTTSQDCPRNRFYCASEAASSIARPARRKVSVTAVLPHGESRM